MVEQLKLGGVIGSLIEIFKARNTQGSYLGAGFRVSPLGTLFVFISSLPPLANCLCVWKKRAPPSCLCESTYQAENSFFFFLTLILDFSFTRSQLITPCRTAALGSAATEMKTR